eukprot:scaffold7387_cov408-Prasinococcus_capsulatus_cf.AAC.19
MCGRDVTALRLLVFMQLLLAFPLALTLPFALFETPKRKSVYEECLYRFGLPQVIATSCFDVCAAIALFFCLLYSRRKYFVCWPCPALPQSSTCAVELYSECE